MELPLYKKIDQTDIPKRERKSGSRFESTPDWRAMRTDLEKGLKPKQALQVVLSDDEAERYGITNRRTVARFLQKYITDRDLPYAVKTFRRDELNYYVVRHA